MRNASQKHDLKYVLQLITSHATQRSIFKTLTTHSCVNKAWIKHIVGYNFKFYQLQKGLLKKPGHCC